jgi:hypothetical protein
MAAAAPVASSPLTHLPKEVHELVLKIPQAEEGDPLLRANPTVRIRVWRGDDTVMYPKAGAVLAVMRLWDKGGAVLHFPFTDGKFVHDAYRHYTQNKVLPDSKVNAIAIEWLKLRLGLKETKSSESTHMREAIENLVEAGVLDRAEVVLSYPFN